MFDVLPWGLIQTGHRPEQASFFETLFTLSNGYQGLRGTVDFDSPHAIPGAFLADVYSPGLTVPLEIVNVANWLPLRCALPDAPPFALDGPAVIDFRRVLSYRRALTITRLRLRDEAGRIVRLIYAVLVHAAEPSLGLVFGTVEAENFDGPIHLDSWIDNRFGNSYAGGYTPSVSAHHCRLTDAHATEAHGAMMRMETRGSGWIVEVHSRLTAAGAARWQPLHRLEVIGERLTVPLERGRPIAFRKTAVVAAAHPGAPAGCAALLARMAALESRELVAAHRHAWRRRWAAGVARIEGDRAADARLQFSLFHLIQAMAPKRASCTIGARGLTSEYHSGHFFFNTELFKLPFFVLTAPDRARALLRFRCDRLEQARAHARETGHGGARFPEESDILGNPANPWEISDLYTRNTIYEWSGKETKFISALVALACHWYWLTSGDDAFIWEYGLAVLIETARYSASLAEWDQAAGSYVVRRVMCPDEYHYHADNNAFTNAVIRRNLDLAADTAERLASEDPVRAAAVRQHLGYDAAELAAWRRIANKIKAHERFEDGVIEQFDGYRDLPDVTIERRDARGRPVLEGAIAKAAAGLENFQTRVIKEADVVLLHTTLPELHDRDQQRRDLAFYEPRTTLETSLAAAPYGVLAARLGQAELAHRMFMLSAGYNVDFVPREAYRNGVHLAAGAGAWQILVQGLFGLSFAGPALHFCPQPLPESFAAVRFQITWRGASLAVWLSADRVIVDHLGDGPALTLRPRRADGGPAREASVSLAPGGRYAAELPLA